MTKQRPQTHHQVRVFISYSRKDLGTAESLRDRLIKAKCEAYLDQHDILPGEPWQERLGKLIEAADAVVFLISPDAVKSEICDWEVNETERLGKRLLPVVVRETSANTIPGRLRRLNYIFMRDPTEEKTGITRLIEALNTDIAWVREHTRLGELASDWERGNRGPEFLLRGTTLAAAEAWISVRIPEGMEPTSVQRDFIRASRVEALAQAVRAGRTQVLIGILVIAMLSAVGYLGWANRAYLSFRGRLLLDTYLPTILSPLKEHGLKPGQSFRECANCPEMVLIPAGEFLMGSRPGEGRSSEYPQHRVRIARPFAVSKFLVTFDQWDACMAHGGCAHRADDRGWGRGLLPVTDVSWEDAQSYVAWLSKQTGKRYRLLSEAEWEYSARAGTVTKYPWGDEVGVGNANCPDCGSQWDDKQPSPVGSFRPNAFGLYDMIGNLWEWVEDNWHNSYKGAPEDGSAWHGGDTSQRVTRGGGWGGGGDDYSAYRNFARPPDFRNYIFGIRVARVLPP